MKQFIYADNAATTQLDLDAFNAMVPWLTEEYGNASQSYSFARKPKKALAEARETIARCIGALPEEIYFTSGGTESNNWAIKGTTVFGRCKSVITSTIEHHAVLRACAAIEKLGYLTIYLPVDCAGTVHSGTLEEALRGNEKKLVSIMMANNEIGTVEPVAELSRIAHEHGAVFHTDAVQAVGHVPIDVQELEVDMLSASAHKFNGPKGIGFLYIRRGLGIAPYLDGGSQEHGMRAGTENIALIVGMAAALKGNCEQMAETERRLSEMERVFIETLNTLGVDFRRNGAKAHIPGNISISINGASGEMLLHRLDLKGVSVSTASACDSANTQVSHVIRAIGVSDQYAQGTIRVSFGRNNSVEESKAVAKAIAEILCLSKA